MLLTTSGFDLRFRDLSELRSVPSGVTVINYISVFITPNRQLNYGFWPLLLPATAQYRDLAGTGYFSRTHTVAKECKAYRIITWQTN